VFEGKARWLLTVDAGIVARQVFEQPSPDIFRFSDSSCGFALVRFIGARPYLSHREDLCLTVEIGAQLLSFPAGFIFVVGLDDAMLHKVGTPLRTRSDSRGKRKNSRGRG
jgi:hypothetical protein